MSMYMLLCNFTDQAIRSMKETPNRRAAAQEKAKKLGVEVKAAYLAMGVYDLILQIDAKDEETLAKYVLSLAGMGNLRTTTLKLFDQAAYDRIVGGLV